jgi:hypothetical protein
MIHFYNKNRRVVLELYDFSFINAQEPIMRFSANISYDIYRASREIEDFKVYLESFLNELILLNTNKVEFAQFLPIDNQLEIYFRRMDLSYISVSIKLNHINFDEFTHNMYKSTLSINYEIDQSFLPELIEEISTVVPLP